jgi:hypothetical protein
MTDLHKPTPADEKPKPATLSHLSVQATQGHKKIRVEVWKRSERLGHPAVLEREYTIDDLNAVVNLTLDVDTEYVIFQPIRSYT